jgi:hypothetical protein
LLLLAHRQKVRKLNPFFAGRFFSEAIPAAELVSALITASAWELIAEMLPRSLDPDEVGKKTVARVRGSESFANHPLVSGIVSGKHGADRLDDVVRDARYGSVCDTSVMENLVIHHAWEQDSHLQALRTVLYDRVYRAPQVQIEEGRFRRKSASQVPPMRLTEFLELPSDSTIVNSPSCGDFTPHSNQDHKVPASASRDHPGGHYR